ncbi:hypothetical protein HOLleu_39010 [Holothuria leucospilota]|uniref:Ig-like domain-containing protein n=1 Tax=Holothuria leucospilota TaxID=206669 RepID=A0A9Q1BE06_HOLLE|nr:hypothetical protein HOLleu_39010 [Holothuria leucospilota]
MGEFTLLTRLVIACLCVKKTHALCSDGVVENVEGVYGQDARLSCRASSQCKQIHWKNNTKGAFVPPTDTDHTFVMMQGRTSSLHISPVTLDDDGPYVCWCYDSDGSLQGDSPICSVNLTTICQASVIVNGATFIYNSSDLSQVSRNVLNVTEHNTLKVECHEDALLKTNCAPQSDEMLHMSEITARSPCKVSCTLRRESRIISKSCIVNISIEIQRMPIVHHSTTVTIPTTSLSNLHATGNLLPILIPLITVVCVLLVIALVLRVYIFSPKLTKRSQFKGNSNPVYPNNVEETPAYEMVGTNTDRNMSISSISIKQEDAAADDPYTLVSSAYDGNVSDQQDPTTVESPVVTNLYSEVNKPNDSGKMNERAAMEYIPSTTNEVYSEVSKGDGVVQNDFENVSVGKELCGGYEKLSNIKVDNQAAENPNISSSENPILDYEDQNTDDPGGDEFAGLYAVVDKTKTKSQQD